jgi:uncharacterized membrane protein
MKLSAIAIVIGLLLSFGAHAASDPGIPQNRASVASQIGLPSESSEAHRVEKPIQTLRPGPTEQHLSSIQPLDQQKIVSVPQKLEEPLIGLTRALTKFVEEKSEPENASTKVVDFLTKLGVLVATIIGCYVSYAGIRKIPWFAEHREFVVTAFTAIFLLVLFYLLSGLVTSVLYVLVAILILLISLFLAAAHLLKFIDEKYPDVRDNILAHFSESSSSRSAQKLVRDNVRNMFEWLSNIVFMQRVNGDTLLTLVGSFVDGFDTSIFEIEADDRVLSHWEIINDKMLIPVKMNLRVIDSSTGTDAQIVNIQLGLVVVKMNNKLQFKKFSNAGFQVLGAALIQLQATKMKEVLESQKQFSANATIFNSQTF